MTIVTRTFDDTREKIVPLTLQEQLALSKTHTWCDCCNAPIRSPCKKKFCANLCYDCYEYHQNDTFSKFNLNECFHNKNST